MSENTLTLPLSRDEHRRVPVREWTVEVIAGPDKGRRFATLDNLARIGTDDTNDLVLTDNTVSRRHLEIERTSRGLELRDLGSRNGTLLDDRLVFRAIVGPGDRIDLGKTRLAVLVSEADTERELFRAESFGDLVGQSDAMRMVFAELRRVASEGTTLLLEGETGTGKELAARAVHAHSPRRDGAFRIVDCAMLTSENAERDLFGSEGAFQSAQGGTIFLDEVSELPASVQPKLLRALDTKILPATGGHPEQPIDARIISSTQRNLAEEVQRGRFRQDLLFRIAVIRIRLPPLRTHKSDIPALAQHLLQGLGAPLALSDQTLGVLEGYDWPGNVRELRNVLERGALLRATGRSEWLDFLAPEKGAEGRQGAKDQLSELPYHEAKDRILAEFERSYFAEVMKSTSFDFRLAEKRTGLSMQSLYRLLKKNGLRVKDLKNAEGVG